MNTTTIADKKSALQERHKKAMQKLALEGQIIEALPDGLPMPCISNISEKDETFAWLSFSPEYGQDEKAFALSVFQTLEAAGAEVVPLSLCKYGTWRRSVYPAASEDVPEQRRNDTLGDVEPLAPLWVEPNQFTGVEARAFYRIAGRVYRVTVKTPLRAHLHCRRVEFNGGWRFEGPASVSFPDGWHSLHTPAGESVANISQHTRAYRDTKQGISGTIYWQPLTEQGAYPLTPAAMLAQLLIA